MPLADRKVLLGLAYASGTADRTGAVVDMSGFQEIEMILVAHAVATGATYSIKAQGAVDAAFSTPVDIAGTAQVIADDQDGDIYVCTITRPPYRYVRLYVDKDTSNACAETVVYVQHGPDAKPVTTASGTVNVEEFFNPAAGTA
jgi:hypothetical protein